MKTVLDIKERTPGVVVYIFNPSNWEAERGDLWSSRPARPTQLALVSCLQTKKINKRIHPKINYYSWFI